MNRSLAEHVASVGKLPVLDALDLAETAPSLDGSEAADAADTSSSARVSTLIHALKLKADARIPAGPLLLVDARYRTGWSITVAAALLREAGSTAVLPLVLHQLP